MNIFAVDHDPVIAASMLCDQHVVKQILESTQMLYTVFYLSGEQPAGPAGLNAYRATHIHHGCVKWTAETLGNYLWLVEHALAMVAEHQKRYNPKRPHKCLTHLKWLEKHPPKKLVNEHNLTVTPFYTAFGNFRELCEVANDPIQSYRNYYSIAKKSFKNGNIPTWKSPAKKPDWLYLV
jgi:hypothetical protein